MIEPEICQFAASDGYRFHYRHWRTAGERPLGYVVALHGIQSHSGWFTYSSSRLCEAGYDVRFLDRRGSGLNEQSRGDAPHCDRLINDVVQFLAEVRHERNAAAPASPVILLSVSWGGKLAVATCARRSELVDALALLYPGICSRLRPRVDQDLALRAAPILGRDRQHVPIPLGDPVLFTGIPEWQAFIRDDPLALHSASASFLRANLDLDRLAVQASKRIRCPVLMMLAGRDQIIDNRASRRYFERIASSTRTLIEYPEAQHTLEFEPDRDRVIADLAIWMNSIRSSC